MKQKQPSKSEEILKSLENIPLDQMTPEQLETLRREGMNRNTERMWRDMKIGFFLVLWTIVSFLFFAFVEPSWPPRIWQVSITFIPLFILGLLKETSYPCPYCKGPLKNGAQRICPWCRRNLFTGKKYF